MGNVIRCISSDGSVMAMVIDSTAICNESAKIHQTSAVVTAAMGRLLSAASMMGAMLKGKNDSLTMRVKGDGPVGSLLAVADSNGNVKGYPANPVVELPLSSKGKLDVGRAVGKNGVLTVIKDLGLKEPYVGQLELVSGEIAEDITAYYAQSEQIPTVCSLGVLVDTDLSVKNAGGMLLQLLPAADEGTIDRIEANVAKLPSMTHMLSHEMTPDQICRQALDGFDVEVLDSFDTVYQCDCSRERVERALMSLSLKELEEMAADKKNVEVGCQFCNGKYVFPSQEIYGMFLRRKKK